MGACPVIGGLIIVETGSQQPFFLLVAALTDLPTPLLTCPSSRFQDLCVHPVSPWLLTPSRQSVISHRGRAISGGHGRPSVESESQIYRQAQTDT